MAVAKKPDASWPVCRDGSRCWWDWNDVLLFHEKKKVQLHLCVNDWQARSSRVMASFLEFLWHTNKWHKHQLTCWPEYSDNNNNNNKPLSSFTLNIHMRSSNTPITAPIRSSGNSPTVYYWNKAPPPGDFYNPGWWEPRCLEAATHSSLWLMFHHSPQAVSESELTCAPLWGFCTANFKIRRWIVKLTVIWEIDL